MMGEKVQEIAERENATVKKSAAGTVKAENSAAFPVLAKNVEGNLNTMLDWKSAAAFGAVFGGFWGLLTLPRRR